MIFRYLDHNIVYLNVNNVITSTETKLNIILSKITEIIEIYVCC